MATTALQEKLQAGTRNRARGVGIRQWAGAFIFLAPWIIGVLVFYAYPILASFYYGFTQYDVLREPIWVGLQNFRQMPNDRYFIQAINNTIIYVAVAVPGALLIGFLQAMLLNVRVKGQQVFRTLALVPGTIPIAAAAAVWVFIATPGSGLINNVLNLVGLPNQTWLASPSMVKWVFVGITVWSGSGMLVFLAGLQAVPPELYEAAEVDGAGWWVRFRHVTVPMMTPSILFNLLMGLIGAFQYWQFPMLMTEGGPVGGSRFFGHYIYTTGFEFWKMGYASAQAWILFLICAIIVFIIFRSSAGWVYYETE